VHHHIITAALHNSKKEHQLARKLHNGFSPLDNRLRVILCSSGKKNLLQKRIWSASFSKLTPLFYASWQHFDGLKEVAPSDACRLARFASFARSALRGCLHSCCTYATLLVVLRLSTCCVCSFTFSATAQPSQLCTFRRIISP
jgi:hypothetical protein